MNSIFGIKFGLDDGMVATSDELISLDSYTVNIEKNEKKEISHMVVKFVHSDKVNEKVCNYLLNNGFYKVKGMDELFMQNGEMMLLMKKTENSDSEILLEINIWHRNFYEKYSELKDSFIIKNINYFGIELGSSLNDGLNNVFIKNNSGFYFYKDDEDKIYKIEENFFLKDYDSCVRKIEEIESMLEKQGMKRIKLKNDSDQVYRLYFSGANPLECYMEIKKFEKKYALKIIIKYEKLYADGDIMGFVQDDNVFHAFGFAFGEPILQEKKDELSKTNSVVEKHMPHAKISLTGGNKLKEINCISRTSMDKHNEEYNILVKNLDKLEFAKKSVGVYEYVYQKKDISISIRKSQNTGSIYLKLTKEI